MRKLVVFSLAVGFQAIQVVSGTTELSHDDLLPYGKPVREAYFQFAAGTIYFNHGGYGATPRPVRHAMEKYTDMAEAQPTQWFKNYHAVLAPVRQRLAKLVNASVSDLVFLDNASAGMNAVLRSLKWQPGDILLVVGSVYAVFPNTAAWLKQQYGIRIVSVSITYPVTGTDDYINPLRQVLASLSDSELKRIRLTVLDHISSYPAVLVPFGDIINIVRKETHGNSLVFVDGAHSLGQIKLDMGLMERVGVDFFVMDGHKWLFSPKGSALLWARASRQRLLEPDVISSENGPGTPFQDRFDYIGTRDYAPWCAMQDALDFRSKHLGGEDRIIRYIHELATWAASMLADRFGTEAVAPSNMTPGIATVRLPLPLGLSPDEQSACAQQISDELVAKHQMQVIPFTLNSPNTTHWARISAQVYLEKADFESLATYTLAIAATCASRLSNINV